MAARQESAAAAAAAALPHTCVKGPGSLTCEAGEADAAAPTSAGALPFFLPQSSTTPSFLSSQYISPLLVPSVSAAPTCAVSRQGRQQQEASAASSPAATSCPSLCSSSVSRLSPLSSFSKRATDQIAAATAPTFHPSSFPGVPPDISVSATTCVATAPSPAVVQTESRAIDDPEFLFDSIYPTAAISSDISAARGKGNIHRIQTAAPHTTTPPQAAPTTAAAPATETPAAERELKATEALGEAGTEAVEATGAAVTTAAVVATAATATGGAATGGAPAGGAATRAAAQVTAATGAVATGAAATIPWRVQIPQAPDHAVGTSALMESSSIRLTEQQRVSGLEQQGEGDAGIAAATAAAAAVQEEAARHSHMTAGTSMEGGTETSSYREADKPLVSSCNCSSSNTSASSEIDSKSIESSSSSNNKEISDEEVGLPCTAESGVVASFFLEKGEEQIGAPTETLQTEATAGSSNNNSSSSNREVIDDEKNMRHLRASRSERKRTREQSQAADEGVAKTTNVCFANAAAAAGVRGDGHSSADPAQLGDHPSVAVLAAAHTPTTATSQKIVMPSEFPNTEAATSIPPEITTAEMGYEIYPVLSCAPTAAAGAVACFPREERSATTSSMRDEEEETATAEQQHVLLENGDSDGLPQMHQRQRAEIENAAAAGAAAAKKHTHFRQNITPVSLSAADTPHGCVAAAFVSQRPTVGSFKCIDETEEVAAAAAAVNNSNSSTSSLNKETLSVSCEKYHRSSLPSSSVFPSVESCSGTGDDVGRNSTSDTSSSINNSSNARHDICAHVEGDGSVTCNSCSGSSRSACSGGINNSDNGSSSSSTSNSNSSSTDASGSSFQEVVKGGRNENAVSRNSSSSSTSAARSVMSSHHHWGTCSSSSEAPEVLRIVGSGDLMKGSSIQEQGRRGEYAAVNEQQDGIFAYTSCSSSSSSVSLLDQAEREQGNERIEREGSDVEEVLARPASPISVADDDDDEVIAVISAAAAATHSQQQKGAAAQQGRKHHQQARQQQQQGLAQQQAGEQQQQEQQRIEEQQRRGDDGAVEEADIRRRRTVIFSAAATAVGTPVTSVLLRLTDDETEERDEEEISRRSADERGKELPQELTVPPRVTLQQQQQGNAGVATPQQANALEMMAIDNEEQQQQQQQRGRVELVSLEGDTSNSSSTHREEEDVDAFLFSPPSSPSSSRGVTQSPAGVSTVIGSRGLLLPRRRLHSNSTSSMESPSREREPLAHHPGDVATSTEETIHPFSVSAVAAAVASHSTTTGSFVANADAEAATAATAPHQNAGERAGAVAVAAWDAARRLPQRLRMRLWTAAPLNALQQQLPSHISSQQQQENNEEEEEERGQAESVATENTSEDDDVEIVAHAAAGRDGNRLYIMTRDNGVENSGNIVTGVATAEAVPEGRSSRNEGTPERSIEEEDVEVVMVRETLPHSRLLPFAFDSAVAGRCFAARLQEQQQQHRSGSSAAAGAGAAASPSSQGLSRLLPQQLTDALSRSGLFFWGRGGGGASTSSRSSFTEVSSTFSRAAAGASSANVWGGGGDTAATGRDIFFPVAAAVEEEEEEEERSTTGKSSIFSAKDMESAPRCTICLLNLKRRHEEMLRLIEQREREEQQQQQQQQQETAAAAGDSSSTSSGFTATDAAGTTQQQQQTGDTIAATAGRGTGERTATTTPIRRRGIEAEEATPGGTSVSAKDDERTSCLAGEETGGIGDATAGDDETATSLSRNRQQQQFLEQQEGGVQTPSVGRGSRRGGRNNNSRQQRGIQGGDNLPNSISTIPADTRGIHSSDVSGEAAAIQEQQQQLLPGGGGGAGLGGSIRKTSPARQQGGTKGRREGGTQQPQNSRRAAAWIAEKFKAMYSGDDVRQPVVTVCGHVFCQGCLLPALQMKRECPVCRRKLTGPRQFFPIFF